MSNKLKHLLLISVVIFLILCLFTLGSILLSEYRANLVVNEAKNQFDLKNQAQY